MAGDFSTVFADLRDVMLKSAKGMKTASDEAGNLVLNAPWPHPREPKLPLYFGGVKLGKAYVSFHLMPLYFNPPLLAQISPELKKRMQGKTCFNFRQSDPALFKSLGELTAKAAQCFSKPIDMAKWGK